jgi:hypothetical protein
LWVLLSTYLIFDPSPLLISLMLFRCSAKRNVSYKKIWDHNGKKRWQCRKVIDYLPGVRSGNECSMKRVAAW